jgi:N-acetylated-alpha-linked acidic dipeptidase
MLSTKKGICILGGTIISLTAMAQQTITGFTAAGSSKQKQLEQQFDAGMSAERIGKNIKDLSAKPHNLGSAGSKAVAENILAQFKSFGWDAKIETYQVLFPTPKSRLLEMTGPSNYKALLKEPALKEDATSNQEDQLPTYNCWSADGDVTAELVFVNYGVPADYETLEKLGITVKGKIVIAKYGRSWRGIKPKIAQEHGAIGCIIYSDPKDDGYGAGDVYPKGAFKNEYGVQRGSILDMVVYPGDPLTPNIGSIGNAKRLDRSEATSLLKIPVLPISYHDAKPLLEAMEGPVVPEDWRGGLPITYHVGPGKTTVHLKVDFNWNTVPAYNVIATLKGSTYPDQWVIRGNHHDAWVNGANDPISGMSSLLEEARSIGAMTKTGWKPMRTLVYCAWDGEEPGLIGSTEWVEDHAAELQQKAVLYINSDGNARGFLNAEGSHALENMMYEVAKDVKDPQTGVSVYERQRANDVVNAKGTKAKQEAMNNKTYHLDAMGSGSDYSSFIQHLGLAALNLGYGGEDDGGEYHSIYDSYDHYTKFKDPGFVYGLALSKTAGRAALRMANAESLPFDFTHLQKTIAGYVKELAATTDQMRESIQTENEIISSNFYQLAADPTKKEKQPAQKPVVPYLDFSPIQNALTEFDNSSKKLALWIEKQDGKLSEKTNILLYQAEQKLLSVKGLPRRPWFKHSIYAPGFYTGYGVKTMPGIREAIEQKNWQEAKEQIDIDAAILKQMADYLAAITQ